MIKIDNESSFKSLLEDNNFVLVDFWAAWCGPCKVLGAALEKIAVDTNYKDLIIGKVNVDENTELSIKFRIQSLPTMMLFKSGKVIDTKIGFSNIDDLKKWIDKHR